MAYRALVLSFIALFVIGLGTAAFAQDKYSDITAAMKELDEAMKHLDKAGGGGGMYGGNKIKAQNLIKEAQKELKEALAFAQGKHPEIAAAMKELDEAAKHLDKAGGGGGMYGGNKIKAQNLIKEAQKELKEALLFVEGDKSRAETGAAPKATEKK
jgi:DNA repair exonuclease SbcCD ATPase subunit